jgi:small subunit ribosomal protein S16
MLMIRFQRIGRTNDPAFRIAVLEKASGPKAGKYVDLVGTYNPKTKAVTLKPDAIKDWMAKGAQVSPSLHNLLVKEGVVVGAKSAKVVSQQNLGKNIAKKKAEDEAAAAKAAEDAAKAEAAAQAAAEAAAAAEVVPSEEPAAEEVTVEAPAEVIAEAEAAPAVEETPAEETVPVEEAPAS